MKEALKFNEAISRLTVGKVTLKNQSTARVVGLVFTDDLYGEQPREVWLDYDEVNDLLNLLYQIREK